MNRTGKVYTGHFNITLTNRLQELQEQTQTVIENPLLMTGWINGNLYEPSKEKFGILPVPLRMQEAVEMKAYVDSEQPEKARYKYLAKQQGTRFAVTSVCQVEEKILFGKLKKSEDAFRKDDFVRGAMFWNREHANGKTIFYKVIIILHCFYVLGQFSSLQLAEHLKAYNNTWGSNANERLSLLVSAEARSDIDIKLGDPARVATSRPVLETVARPLVLTAGLKAPPGPSELRVVHPRSINVPAPPSIHSSSAAPQPSSIRDIPVPSTSSAAPINHRSPVSTVDVQPPSDKTSGTSRRNRTCRRCGRQAPKVVGAALGCSGSRKLSLCTNPCQDCGHRDCPGRDTKKKNGLEVCANKRRG